MTVQLEHINQLQQFFKNTSYYAGIILNAFSDLLCSKLCWHNRLVPICQSHMPGHIQTELGKLLYESNILHKIITSYFYEEVCNLLQLHTA